MWELIQQLDLLPLPKGMRLRVLLRDGQQERCEHLDFLKAPGSVEIDHRLAFVLDALNHPAPPEPTAVELVAEVQALKTEKLALENDKALLAAAKAALEAEAAALKAEIAKLKGPK